jgi:hypothetical protein
MLPTKFSEKRVPVTNMASELTCAHTKNQVAYTVHSGYDGLFVMDMDDKWNQEKVKIAREILQKYPECQTDQEQLQKRVVEYSMQDFEWNWMTKALVCKGKEYHWFFLRANESVQAACIIYHPKSSQIDTEDIFYVDYLAAAFWNRKRPDYIRQFDGLGTILLAHSIKYATEVLKYRPGFSLHSLPQAESYYARLGMTDLGLDAKKENLKFFEASANISTKIMKENYV